MVYCAVVGCTNGSGHGNKFKGSFHSFPKDEKIRNIWIRLLNRSNYTWKKSHFLCSEHFAEEDFVVSHRLAKDLGFSPGKFQLKPGTVPSLKLKGNVAESTKSRRSLAVSKRRNLEALRSVTAGQSCVLEPYPQPVANQNDTETEAMDIELDSSLEDPDPRSSEETEPQTFNKEVGTQYIAEVSVFIICQSTSR